MAIKIGELKKELAKRRVVKDFEVNTIVFYDSSEGNAKFKDIFMVLESYGICKKVGDDYIVNVEGYLAVVEAIKNYHDFNAFMNEAYNRGVEYLYIY